MMLGKLSFDKELSDGLRGIPWRELNEKFKNYNAVMEVIRGRVGEDKWPLYERFIDKVLGELRRLNLRLMERSTG
jgi:hypothetical protein